MKIYKSEIKKLIKEVINEIQDDEEYLDDIDEGGPGSGQKGHKTNRPGKITNRPNFGVGQTTVNLKKKPKKYPRWGDDRTPDDDWGKSSSPAQRFFGK